jgi:fused signal recognition particle receptor
MFDRLKKRLSEAIKGFAKSEEVSAESPKESSEAATEATATKEVDAPAKLKASETEAESPHGEKPQSHVEENIRISLGTKIKGSIIGNVQLGEREVDDFVQNIKVLLLESDVSFETAESISESLRERLLEERIGAKDMKSRLVELVRASLEDVMKSNASGPNIVEFVKARKVAGQLPVRILFLGPNGTGKTTTMAKVAKLLSSEGISTVFSASDTFRAAAIEQSEYHAKKVGAPIIKSTYGADPASVAFDAIKYATAHGIDTVLIDTAGRQETNRNLLREVEKMYRVAKPDITVYVAESTGGNAVLGQIGEFSKSIKVDGIILTKLDCDAKGGNAISIAHSAGIPILFLGTGESYDDIVPYSPDFILDRIIPAA